MPAPESPERLPVDHDFNIIDMVDDPDASLPEPETAPDSSLPVKFYKLEANPFLDNVNPEYFYRTDAHVETFLKMQQCVENDVAIGLTTAISGTGKTLLTQLLLNDLQSKPEKYRPVITLVYPSMSPTALLREIATELDIQDLPKNPRVDWLVAAIQEEIMRLSETGIKPVIIIDEVHFLRAQALHIVRTLSNIETSRRKLVTILLFGEETFLDRMNHPGYRSLFSRMFTRCSLRPLRDEETRQYVKFRLLVSGARPNLFDDTAFELIHEHSGGIPREINRLCHNALQAGAELRLPIIDGNLIRKLAERDS